MKNAKPKHDQGWLPIETAPKDGITVLLTRIYHRTVFIGRWREKEGYWQTRNPANVQTEDFDKRNPPTHWQHLPMPPKGWHAYPIPCTHEDYRNHLKPKRIALSRAKGWRLPPNTVMVARPTKWGNPYRVDGEYTKLDAVRDFRIGMTVPDVCQEVEERLQWIRTNVHKLRGKNLACWCKDEPCHATVLLELANSITVNKP